MTVMVIVPATKESEAGDDAGLVRLRMMGCDAFPRCNLASESRQVAR